MCKTFCCVFGLCSLSLQSHPKHIHLIKRKVKLKVGGALPTPFIPGSCSWFQSWHKNIRRCTIWLYKCAMPLDIWQTSSSVNMQKLYQGGSGTGLVNQFISRHAKGVSRWRNRSDRPGKCWTTVCYTAPEEASRCYLSNPKFQKISCMPSNPAHNTSTIFCQTKAQMLLPPLCIQLHWRDSNIHSLSLCTNFKWWASTGNLVIFCYNSQLCLHQTMVYLAARDGTGMAQWVWKLGSEWQCVAQRNTMVMGYIAVSMAAKGPIGGCHNTCETHWCDLS